MLRLGKRGRKVCWLQRNLKWLAFNPGPVDGIFGSKTRAAVVRFQKWAGLTTDGIVGPKTSTQLLQTCLLRPSISGIKHEAGEASATISSSEKTV